MSKQNLYYKIILSQNEFKDKIKNYGEVKLKAEIKSKVKNMKLLMKRIESSCNNVDAGVDMVADFYFSLLTNPDIMIPIISSLLQHTKEEIQRKILEGHNTSIQKYVEGLKNKYSTSNKSEDDRLEFSKELGEKLNEEYGKDGIKHRNPLLMVIFDDHPSTKVLDIVGQCAEDNCTLELISYLEKRNSKIKSISIEWITIEAKKGEKPNCLTYEYKKKCNICQVVFEPRLRSLLRKYFNKNEICHLDENVEKDFEGCIKDEEDIEDIDVLDIENEENEH
eukprot:gene12645-6548_t